MRQEGGTRLSLPDFSEGRDLPAPFSSALRDLSVIFLSLFGDYRYPVTVCPENVC